MTERTLVVHVVDSVTATSFCRVPSARHCAVGGRGWTVLSGCRERVAGVTLYPILDTIVAEVFVLGQGLALLNRHSGVFGPQVIQSTLAIERAVDVTALKSYACRRPTGHGACTWQQPPVSMCHWMQLTTHGGQRMHSDRLRKQQWQS
jgi:hypothetical protein